MPLKISYQLYPLKNSVINDIPLKIQLSTISLLKFSYQLYPLKNSAIIYIPFNKIVINYIPISLVISP